MNPVALAKTIYEKIPKGVKYTFAPIFVRIMVKNKVFVKTWSELNKFEHLSETERKQYQFNKLKELMVYAKQNVPYYREIFEKSGFNPEKMKNAQEIGRLPLLEKSDAIMLGERLYSSEKGLAYYKSFTGGSSGQALTVMLDKDSIYRERAVVTHFLSRETLI